MTPIGALHRMLQSAWRTAPAPLRYALGPRIEFSVRRAVLGAPPSAQPVRGSLVVSHYGDAAFGIARAGRLTAAALRLAGLDVEEHDIRPALQNRRVSAGTLPGSGGVWIAHCNPEHAAALLSHIARADWAERYRIGYWAWELPRAPRLWFWMTRYFHEIWVPSAYVAGALSGAPGLIRVQPHPVPLAPPTGHEQGAPVRILTMADLRSAQTRKNPLGAIEAFKRAFPATQQHALLRVKLNGVAFDPISLSKLRAATRPDIEIIEQVLTDAEVDALLAKTDIFLSLHRAEGFGLPIAEAMARGLPALATAWSGNMDFMRGLDDMLVEHTMTPVRDGSGVYGHRSMLWAEPDFDDAARKLRRLVDDASLRARLGAAGRAQIAGLASSWSSESLAAQRWRALVKT